MASTRGVSVKRESFSMGTTKNTEDDGAKAATRNDVLQSLMALSAKYSPSPPGGAPGANPSLNQNRTVEPVGPKHPYNEEQVEGFRALFNIHDSDQSGGIDEKELGSLVSKSGVVATAAEVKKIHKMFDTNSDGIIDFEEFLVMMSKLHEMDLKKKEEKYATNYTPEKLAEFQALFDKFDADGTGGLDREELIEALKTANVELSDSQLTDFITSVDTDKNGIIDFNEFIQIMNVSEETVDGKKMTVEEIVNKNLMRHHEEIQKRRRSVNAGTAAGRRASMTGDSIEEVAKAAERATLVAGGLEEDAAAAREIAQNMAQLALNKDLFKAASGCKVDQVKELLGKAADPSWTNPEQEEKTALHATCSSTIKNKQAVLDTCTTLIEAGVDINGTDSEGNTPLYLACGTGPIVVDYLLSKGADFDAACGEKMSTSLIRASAFGHTEMVVSFVAKGVNLNARNIDGQTALIRSVQTKRVDICRVLLEAGCDHTIEDIQGLAAMDFGQRLTLDKQQMMQVLEEFKCKPGSQEPESEKTNEKADEKADETRAEEPTAA